MAKELPGMFCDRLADVQTVLVNLVRAREDLVLDQSSKQTVRFGHVSWEGLPRGKGWTRSGRLVLFQFDNLPDRLDLRLWIGPGPAPARLRLFDAAKERQPPFGIGKRKPNSGNVYFSLYSRRFLKPEDYEDASLEKLASRIEALWEQFVGDDLPRLAEPIQSAATEIGATASTQGVGSSRNDRESVAGF